MQKTLTLKSIWGLLKAATKGFYNDNVPKLSGSLAFFTMFSIGPMLVVIIFLTSLFWERGTVESAVLEQMKNMMGADAALQLQEMIKNAAVYNDLNTTAVVGFFTLLIGTTSVFSEIQDSINIIWQLDKSKKPNFFKTLLNRIITLSIVVSWFFILLVSLIFNGLTLVFIEYIKNLFPQMSAIVAGIINVAFTFCTSTILFTLIFKVLPNAHIRWKPLLVGATGTAILFLAGKYLISFYLAQSNVGSTYGAAGSLIILLVWIYYSSNILYFGAEFTKAYALKFGDAISEAKHVHHKVGRRRGQKGFQNVDQNGEETHMRPA